MYPTLDEIIAELLRLDELHGHVYGRRFLKKIKLGQAPPYAPEMGPCIMWTKALDTKGYGTFKGITLDGVHKQMPAYQWLYQQMTQSKPPPGYELHHACHDEWRCTPDIARDCPHRRCVRHVTPITVRENRARDTRAGRNMRRILERARAAEAGMLF